MFMVTDKKKRIFAVALSAVLGITSVISYNGFLGSATADDTNTTEKITFAEGEGTGRDFSEDSWQFAGKLKDGGGAVPAEHAPKIVKDKDDGNYLNDDSTVIRLIRDVKAADATSGMEASTSYDKYRSGEAFLSNGIMMDTKAKFSVKFTFSMPEAVVNTVQTTGAENAREVGGDGIAFVMTTNSTHDVQAGSGIGYQGIDNSVAVELDSYFNGAYCDMKEGQFAYQNWGFDNQLYFHAGQSPDGVKDYGNPNPWLAGYENYVNKNHAERFDHVGVTLDGNVKKHEAISYINGKDPTEMEGDQYIHLANRYYHTNTGTDVESTESTCATRFADKGVNDRLFTVWIDYDGSKMDVSYANGKFSTAEKPATPQISTAVDLSKFDGKKVYMGFTSAIGSSKANHTIHSFQFVNRYDASYKLNYYLKNKTTGEYELKKSSDVLTGEVGTDVTADDVDKDYKTAYDAENYTLSAVKTQETSVNLAEAGKTYEMNVYYDPVVPTEAYYKLNYYKFDSEKGGYVLTESTNTATGKVGDSYKVTDVDPSYATKYENFTVNEQKKDDFTVTLTEAGKTYEMNVYYDPVKPIETPEPDEASYKLNYYLKNKITGEYELKKTSDTAIGKVGADVTAADVDKNYETAFKNENYVFSKDHKQETSVTLTEAGKTYEMNVYYDPEEAYYKLNYYKFDKDKKEYVLTETTKTVTGYVGSEYKITDVDPAYGTKYPNYSVNENKKDDFDVKLTEAGKTYEMNVYYDPEEAGYKLNYHKLNPNTEKYEYIESTVVIEGTVGSTYKVTDADADYELKYSKDGYSVNKDKNETYSVTIENPDKTYEMDVYYDPVKTTYKTEYYLQQPDGSYKLKDTVQGEQTYAGKNVTAPEKTYDGYTHVAIPDSLESAVVNADGSTTMKVYYNYEKDPVYKVEYYVEQPDGSYKLYTEKADISGKTGQEVTPEIITIDGYEHTTTPDTNEKDIVRADSSTVLKVYYKAKPVEPTEIPTIEPTVKPTIKPTVKPTVKPTKKPTPTPEEVDNDDPGAPNVHRRNDKPSNPDTGDHNNMGAYVVLALSSLAVLAGGVISRKRIRK